MRFLDIVRPFMVVLPEVSKPDRRIPFREKVRTPVRSRGGGCACSRRGAQAMYSLIVLFIYLWCSQIPLYGIRSSNSADPFYWYCAQLPRRGAQRPQRKACACGAGCVSSWRPTAAR